MKVTVDLDSGDDEFDITLCIRCMFDVLIYGVVLMLLLMYSFLCTLVITKLFWDVYYSAQFVWLTTPSSTERVRINMGVFFYSLDVEYLCRRYPLLFTVLHMYLKPSPHSTLLIRVLPFDKNTLLFLCKHQVFFGRGVVLLSHVSRDPAAFCLYYLICSVCFEMRSNSQLSFRCSYRQLPPIVIDSTFKFYSLWILLIGRGSVSLVTYSGILL